MLRAQLGLSVRGYQQNRGAGESGGEYLQHEKAAGVGPMQIVEHEQERAAAGGLDHVVREGAEEPTTGRARLSGGLGLETGQALPELGQQDGQLGAVLPQVLLQVVVARDLRQPTEHLDPGPVGRQALGFVAAPPSDGPAARESLVGKLLGEAGLADARVTHQQRRVPVAAARVVPSRQEIGHLARSTDESFRAVRRRGPCRVGRRRQGDCRRCCRGRPPVGAFGGSGR